MKTPRVTWITLIVSIQTVKPSKLQTLLLKLILLQTPALNLLFELQKYNGEIEGSASTNSRISWT